MNTNSKTTSTQTASDENQPLMFDEALNTIFRDAIEAAFLTVPELRSVVVNYDYRRNLNDVPSLSKGMWLSADGNEQKTPDSMAGSLASLLQSAAHILDENFQMLAMLQVQLTEVSTKILEKQNELKALKDG
jgi:hypothetical protein